MSYLRDKAEQDDFLEVGLRHDISKLPVSISHVFCEQMLLFHRKKPTFSHSWFLGA